MGEKARFRESGHISSQLADVTNRFCMVCSFPFMTGGFTIEGAEVVVEKVEEEEVACVWFPLESMFAFVRGAVEVEEGLVKELEEQVDVALAKEGATKGANEVEE